MLRNQMSAAIATVVVVFGAGAVVPAAAPAATQSCKSIPAKGIFKLTATRMSCTEARRQASRLVQMAGCCTAPLTVRSGGWTCKPRERSSGAAQRRWTCRKGRKTLAYSPREVGG